jgi:uncharacterized protein
MQGHGNHMEEALKEKFSCLKAIIRQNESVLVAFSGGVDSTLLLAVCHEVLADRVMAVTVRHSAVDEDEIADATKLARMLGVNHHILDVGLAFKPIFEVNPANRCYLCKQAIFQLLLARARQYGIETVMDASQADDLEEDRPGLQALAELGIITPLKVAGLGKRDIRRISKYMGLPTHDKPARPCLATRFPPGESIHKDKLIMVKQAESYLSELGLQNHRVRFRDGEARIEVPLNSVAGLLDADTVSALSTAFRAIGFSGIFLDLPGCLSRTDNL